VPDEKALAAKEEAESGDEGEKRRKNGQKHLKQKVRSIPILLVYLFL